MMSTAMGRARFYTIILTWLGLIVSTTSANMYGYIGSQGECVCPSQSMMFPQETTMSMMVSPSPPRGSSRTHSGVASMSQPLPQGSSRTHSGVASMSQPLPQGSSRTHSGVASMSQPLPQGSSRMHSSAGQMSSHQPSSKVMMMNHSCAANSSCASSNGGPVSSPIHSSIMMHSDMSLSQSISSSGAPSTIPSSEALSAIPSEAGIGNIFSSMESVTSSSQSMMQPMNNSMVMVNESSPFHSMFSSMYNMSKHSMMPIPSDSLKKSMTINSSMLMMSTDFPPSKSERTSSMNSNVQRCSCGKLVSSQHYSSIQPSRAMSSMLIGPSSSIAMVEPAKNETTLNSVDGFQFRRAVAVRGLNFQSGKIEIRSSAKTTWTTLASVSFAESVVIQSGGSIRFVHSDRSQEYYGVAVIEFIPSDLLSSGTVDTSSSPSQSSNLYILIEPNTLLPRFNSTASKMVTIEEDSLCTQSFKPSHMNSSADTLTFQQFKFDNKSFLPFQRAIDSNIFKQFQRTVAAKANFAHGYWIKKYTFNQGRWYHFNDRTKKPFKNLSPKWVVDEDVFRFCFVPFADLFGEVELEMTPVYRVNNQKNIFGTQTVKFVVRINATNDRPVVRDPKLEIKPLPYNMSGYSNTGVTVSEFITKSYGKNRKSVFSDKDKDTLGIAVISARDTMYGSWEYKCSGGSWTAMNVTYEPPLIRLNHTVLLLTPTDSVRFVLKNHSLYWTKLQAIERRMVLQVLAWDQTDSQVCGTYQHTGMSWPDSMSMKFVSGYQLRMSCDGRPGFVLTIDGCGDCGGGGKRCRGCDGSINSGAKIDSCGQCTGGATGKVKNYMRDCGGGCGRFTNATTCGNCIRVGDTRNYTDCNGDCFGSAKINKCGNCAGGRTGRNITFGEDKCRICGGNSSSCADCAGVANGLNKVDLCGSCLLPTSAGFNSGCSKLGAIKPNVFYVGQLAGVVRAIVGRSGPAVSGNAVCFFYIESSFSSLHNSTGTISGKKISLAIPATLAGGVYSIQCDVPTSSSTRSNLNVTNTLMIVDQTSMAVSGVSPQVVDYTETKSVTVTGAGFIDTKEIACLFVKEINGQAKTLGSKMTASYINATQVSCELKRLPRSFSGKLVLSFVDHNRANYYSLNTTLHRSANLSDVQGGNFSSDLGSLIIDFDSAVKLTNQSASCRDLFPQNYTQFGTSPRCVIRGRKLIVVLDGTDATVSTGSLYLDLTELAKKPGDYTVHPQSMATVSLSIPPGVEAPNIILVAPLKIGRCEDLSIQANKIKGGGRQLSYSWSVAWGGSNSGAVNSKQNSNLTSVNKFLNVLPDSASEIKLAAVNLGSHLMDVDLDVTVTITNFLGLNRPVTVTVRRENRDLPQLVLSKRNIKVKASKKIVLLAKANLPGCAGGNDAQMSFLWSLSNADGQQATEKLNNAEVPRLIIPPQTLSGGKTYKARVDVSMVTDSTLTTYNEVTIEVIESELVAKIRGRQTVGSTETLVLSAKGSFDPDGVKYQTPIYNWQILTDEGGSIVKDGTSRVLSYEGFSISVNVQQNLNPDQKYKATLSYRVGSREATAEFIFEVKAGAPSQITLTEFATAQNPSKKIRMLAKVSSQSDIKEKPEWLIADGQIEGVTKGNNKRSLYVLSPGLLDEDLTYSVEVSVANVDATSTTTMSFKTNSKPIAGLVSVEPMNGTEFTTEFTLKAKENGGWYDPDADDTLMYEAGSVDAVGKEVPFGERQSSKEFTKILLKKGSQQLYVKCCDTNSACAVKYITVSVAPVVVDAAFASAVDAERIKRLEMKDFSGSAAAGVTGVGVLIASLASSSRRRRRRSIGGGSSTPDCSAFDSSTINTQTSALEGHLTSYETGNYDFDLSGDESRDLYIQQLSSFTVCGHTILTPSNIERTYNALSEIIGGLAPRTVVQSEADLLVYDNIVKTDGYEAAQQATKAAYIASASRQSQRMCLALLTGEDASVVKSSLTTIQSVKLSFQPSEANLTKLGCDECMPKPAYVDFKGLKTSWGVEYTCGDSTCTGACVASFQYPEDMHSNSSNSSMLSAVVDIQLFDSGSTTAGSLNVTSISGGIDLQIHITKETNNTYKCLRWENSTQSWEASGVTTMNDDTFTKNSLSYVHCQLLMLSPVAVFEGPERIQPSNSSVLLSSTISPSVSLNNSMSSTVAPTTTLAPRDYPRKVRFTYPLNNCTNSYLVRNKNIIKTQLASSLNISDNTMTEFNLTCGSIVVTYTQIHSSSISAEAAVALLKQKIEQNNLIIIVENVTLVADNTSLTFTIEIPAYATTPATPTEKDKSLSGGAIAGIVIGVLIFVLLIALVVYFLGCKKSTTVRKDNQVEPNANDVELRGKSNQAYQ